MNRSYTAMVAILIMAGRLGLDSCALTYDRRLSFASVDKIVKEKTTRSEVIAMLASSCRP